MRTSDMPGGLFREVMGDVSDDLQALIPAKLINVPIFSASEAFPQAAIDCILDLVAQNNRLVSLVLKMQKTTAKEE